ncbi:hypothetical protein JCM19992_31780 [Thermostilla marina]
MTSLSNILLDKEILLESGTNELEILVFEVADYTFGINVAKVREVLPAPEITHLPKAHPSVRGVFKLRNRVIPCVSLLDHLGIYPTRERSESTLILTDLNQQQTGFLVDQVDRIYRLSWKNVLSMPGLSALSHTPVTALTRCDDRLIVMLDFEMILDTITEQFFRTDPIDNPLGLPREELRVLVAEDSPTVRQAIESTLRNSGYAQLEFFDNGETAWQWLEARWEETHDVSQIADLLICDVEMPQVDGFHLTKRIKSHSELNRIPVLLYSSIITPDNLKKGKAVGADAQVAKPELNRVVELADELIANQQKKSRAEDFQAVASLVAQVQEDATGETPVDAPEAPAATAESIPTAPVSEPAADVAPKTADEPPAVDESEPAVETTSADPEAVSTAEAENEASTAQAPETNVSSEDGAALEFMPAEPEGVDPKLWQTFMHELFTHRKALLGLMEQITGDRPELDVSFQIARTLHTIKSAATVVPLDQVTRCTHLMESLLVKREEGGEWPRDMLNRYIGWLDMLMNPPEDDLAGALASGERLAKDLEKALDA